MILIIFIFYLSNYIFIVKNFLFIYLKKEPPTAKEEIKQEDSYSIISNKNHSITLSFQNLNSLRTFTFLMNLQEMHNLQLQLLNL